jgi:hypothetical protein
MVAARLPGRWETTHHDVRSPASAITQFAWDNAQHHDGIPADDPHAAVLDGPDGEQLLVTPSPDRPHRFLAGALFPPGTAIWMRYRPPVARAIAVPDDPARAAAAVTARFLPQYDLALHQLRITAIAHAYGLGETVLASWDALSDSLCDEQGFPLDEEVYGLRQAQRDAQVWTQFSAFLTHGKPLLDRADAQLPDLYDHPDDAPLRQRYQYALRQLRNAHTRGLAVRFPIPGKVAERDAEIWHEMTEWLAHTPYLLTLARQAGPAPRIPQPSHSRARHTGRQQPAAPPPGALPGRPHRGR